jgi:hypothetical protein
LFVLLIGALAYNAAVPISFLADTQFGEKERCKPAARGTNPFGSVSQSKSWVADSRRIDEYLEH